MVKRPSGIEPINLNATKTRAKLEEARFFLKKIKEKQTEFPDVQYYLSAFISSARSILWIMRSEYQGEIGWNEWYASLKPKATSSESKFIMTLNDIRVRLEKVEPLRVGIGMKVVCPKGSFSKDEIKWLRKQKKERMKTVTTVFKKGADIQGKQGFGIIENVYFAIPDFPAKSAISIANKYYNLLKTIILKCEEKFEIKKTAFVAMK